MTTRKFGSYRVLGTRARGRTGVVHEAMDTALDQPVELIELPGFGVTDTKLWSAFNGVMTRLSSVENEAIATPGDFARSPDQGAWYVTDPPRGIPLSALAAGLGRLHWRQATMILHEVAVSLSFAHSRGVAHGNLTPSNVYVDENGSVQIRRFAVLARVHLEVNTESAVSLAALYEGTEYLSPEALAHRTPNLASDVFALGLLAYELLVGEQPFLGMAGIVAHTESNGEPPDPGASGVTIPAAIRTLVVDMLRVRVDQRPPDAGEVAKVLQAQLNDVGVVRIRASLGVELARQKALFASSASSSGTLRIDPDEISARASASTGDSELPAEAQVLISQMMLAASHKKERQSWSPAKWATTLMLILVASMSALYLLGTQQKARLASQTTLGSTPVNPEPRTTSVDDSPTEVEIPPERMAPPPETDFAEVLLTKARASLEAGQLARAERMARQGLEFSGPKHGPLQLVLGAILERQGQVDAALVAYLASDRAVYGQTDGRFAAGFLLGSEGRCKEAIVHYRAAYRMGLNTARLHTLLGSCYLLIGSLEEAVRSLEEARSKGEESVDVLMPLATALDMLGELERAREVYQRVLRLRPQHGQAKNSLDRIDMLVADPAEAAKWLASRKQRAASDDPQALAIEAFAAFTAGQHARAAELYQQIVDRAGEGGASAEQLKNLAVALDRADDGARALPALRRALEANDDDLELHLLLGQRMVSAGQVETAIDHLERATADEALRSTARMQLGLARLAVGDARGAVIDFGTLVAEKPKDTRALQNLADAQVKAGRERDALETLERLSRLSPEAPSHWLTRAAILQRMDRRDEADALLTDACKRGIQEACR